MREKMIKNHRLYLLLSRKREILFAWVFVFVLCCVAAVFESSFLSVLNILNTVNVSVSLCIATFAQLLIILLGGVDMSVGAVISASNVICATMMTDTTSGWVLPVLLSLMFGIGAGACNGILVAKAHQQAIIATLATATVIEGIALLILPNPGGYINTVFSKVLNRGLNRLMPLLVIILFSVIMWLILNRTLFGRKIFATGGNEVSAKSTGIKTERIKFWTFVLTGFLSAVAGVFVSAYVTSGNPVVGAQYTQRSITAAVLGGASLAGGKGSVPGCVAGVLIVSIINNMLNLLGVSSYYQYVFQGILLIAALAINALRAKQ